MTTSRAPEGCASYRVDCDSVSEVGSILAQRIRALLHHAGNEYNLRRPDLLAVVTELALFQSVELALPNLSETGIIVRKLCRDSYQCSLPSSRLVVKVQYITDDEMLLGQNVWAIVRGRDMVTVSEAGSLRMLSRYAPHSIAYDVSPLHLACHGAPNEQSPKHL